MAEVDHDRFMHLHELALDFTRTQLRLVSDSLVKVSGGEAFQSLLQQLKTRLTTVKVRKSPAWRARGTTLQTQQRQA